MVKSMELVPLLYLELVATHIVFFILKLDYFLISIPNTVIKLDAGPNAVFLLTDNSQVYSWGTQGTGGSQLYPSLINLIQYDYIYFGFEFTFIVNNINNTNNTNNVLFFFKIR